MSKVQLYNVYISNLNRLSYKARLILAHFTLDDFDSFFDFFLLKNKRIFWASLSNCSTKTGNEINVFIQLLQRYAKSHSLDLELENKNFDEGRVFLFNVEYQKLSVRTKNILESFGINDIETFVSFLIKKDNIQELSKIRNCGVRSIDEIISFKEKVNRIIINQIIDPQTINDKSSIELESKKEVETTDLKPIAFSGKMEILFHKKFGGLTVRARNILIKLEADSLLGFTNNIIDNPSHFGFLNSRNCGQKTKTALDIFESEIENSIKANKGTLSTSNFFEDLQSYLKDGNILKHIELLIFSNNFCFFRSVKYETLDSIAQQINVTKERVRQISILLLEKLNGIINTLFKKGNYKFDDYFLKDYFIVSESLTDLINKKEGTNFSSSFITLVLSQINTEKFDFLCLSEKPKYYNGILINKSIDFKYRKLITFVLNNYNNRRENDLDFSSSQLYDLFKLGKNVGTEKEIIEKDIFGVLNVLINYHSQFAKHLTIIDKTFIIKRNTKKRKYEYLIDILDLYKKPMHFSELYDECLKLGFDFKSPNNVHSTMGHKPKIFGLKGPGIYGLIKWGGYFGTIGDVTEQLLKENGKAMDRTELENILCRELYISRDSIINVLVRYEPEKRFLLLKKNKIALRIWT